MKKVIFLAALVAAMASCQKPELSISQKEKKEAIIMPASDEEAKTNVSLQIREKQISIMNSFAGLRCNQNGPLLLKATFLPNENVEMYWDAWGRYCAKFTTALTVMATKDCYLPWKFKFVPGQDNYTYNPPTGDTADFSIQYGFFNEPGSFVTGDSSLPGQLCPGSSYGYTRIVSGASRRNGYLSEIKLRANQPAQIDIVVVLVDFYTITGSPIPAYCIVDKYNEWLLNMRAAEKLSDPYTKWVIVGNANTPNTLAGQSAAFPY